MNTIKVIFILVTLFLSEGLFGQRLVGTNLSSIADFNPQFVFKDAFKASREWISFNTDGSGGWDSGVAVPLRADGYPLEIPYDDGTNPPQSVRSLVLWDLEFGYPAGTYTLHLEGTGSVRLIQGASGTFSSPGVYTFVPNGSNFGIEIMASDVADPIHKIEIILPNYDPTYQADPFHPDLMSFIADFEVLRFMDLMQTNFSPIVQWSDRTAEDYYTQSSYYGIAYEYLTQLANDSNKDIWVCIPHQADDNYISNLAIFLQANLNAGLNIYVEYSNEVWNGGFSQSSYAEQQGAALGYTGPVWEQGWKYYAKRSADVFYLFEQIFGVNNPRIIKTIGSLSINSWLSGQIIDFFNDPFYNPNGVTANTLAIAPYFGGEIADQIGNNGEINSITVDQILDRLELTLPGVETDIIDQRNMAISKNVQLITYEAGQHLAGQTYGNNTTLTQKLIAANRHTRMEGIYCTYLDSWYDNVPTGILVNFTSIGKFSQHGSWGIKEFMSQPSSSAPKYAAFENCVFNTPLAVELTFFGVKLTPENKVLINWESYNEEELDYYEIQRSDNNHTFETLGKVEAADLFHYQMKDDSPLFQDSYYRMKMVDIDGSYSYSNIEPIYLNEKNRNSIEVFPNPFSNTIEIVNHQENNDATIQIFDVNGQIVFNVPAQQVQINLNELSAGVYFVHYKSWTQTQIIKIIKSN